MTRRRSPSAHPASRRGAAASFAAALALNDPDMRLASPADGFDRPPLWSAAAKLGPAALAKLAAQGCRFKTAEGCGLAEFCSRRCLAESFSWALERQAPSSAQSWRMACDLAERALVCSERAGTSVRDAEALADAACQAAAHFKAPSTALLASLCSSSKFSALRAALRCARLDRRLAQAICDARFGSAISLFDSLAGSTASMARLRSHQAARAGAALAALRPRIDLARDARSLSPELCAFSLAAGGASCPSSEPPLLALCEAATEAMSPASPAWPLLSELSCMGARGAEPPEALCASLLADAGCSATETSSSGSSAIRVCRRAASKHAAHLRKTRMGSPMGSASTLAAWISLGIGLGNDEEGNPDPTWRLRRIVEAKAEREALSLACSSLQIKSSKRRL